MSEATPVYEGTDQSRDPSAPNVSQPCYFLFGGMVSINLAFTAARDHSAKEQTLEAYRPSLQGFAIVSQSLTAPPFGFPKHIFVDH